MRSTLILLALLISTMPLAAQDVRPFMEKHCHACHSEKVQKGDLRLDTLKPEFKDPKVAAVWAKVYDRLRDGEMPPKTKPQPTADESKTTLTWIADQTRQAAHRPTIRRRLNRYEYENTLRDLLDMPGLDVKEQLPRDGEAEGFDTVADALDISYVQMARYLEIAESVLEKASATALQPLRPETRKIIFWPQNMADWHHRSKEGATVPLGYDGPDPCWDKEKGVIPPKYDLRNGPRVRAMGTFFHSDPAGNLRFVGDAKIPVAGMYKLRISTYSYFWEKGKLLPAKRNHSVLLSTDNRVLGYFDAPKDTPAVGTVTTWLEPSDNIHFNAVTLGHGYGTSKGALSITSEGVAVEWLEAEGPLNPTWPPTVRQKMFGELPLTEWREKSKTMKPSRPKDHQGAIFTPISEDPVKDADYLLRLFISKAYRRPVPNEDPARYMKLVKAKLDAGATFEDAMRTGYKAILCSPTFLFQRWEHAKDAHAVANRLSYFLWSTMPDNTLIDKANGGSLTKPDVLRAQTDRLLDDPRSRRFVEDFTGQWLKLRNIHDNSPDRQLYPEEAFESDIVNYVVDSMAEETRLFFAAMVKENRGVKNLIDSETSFINEPLAKLYGIKDVLGCQHREVKLPPDLHRGGLLTQAAILKVSANGTSTSPVLRGAFITQRILGRNVPPPPPGIEGIDPDVRGSTTIREQLAKHRNNATCASCHAKMDPPGFALESFDVIGGWRDRYRILKGPHMERKGPLIDPTGELDDGRAFKDIDEYRKLLCRDLTPIARNLVSKLLIYSTGTPLTPADRLEVDQIVERLRPNFGVRDMIHEVVQSRAFRQE